ncbi:MAG: efflux RND transporter periplasmic adaptor subunit [Prevotella sp.]|nr:efflux RND transporter periplasmic adaptor subunit [Prevotella sp.]MBR1505795.1 efflux RND transporter periplasmic adaptor subunit [Prevotella sp.]
MKMKRLMTLAAIAATLVSCGSGGGRPSFGDNEYPVVTAGTSSADMQTTYPASIKGVQDVEIRPKAQGFLTQINVKEGQTVSAGQVLFVIDNETYQAQVRQAQAAVNSAQQQVNTAQLTYDNSKQLHANKVIGDYELQTSANTLESAKAGLAQAQAVLATAKEALSYCYVKSPAAGVVGTLPFKKGALVSGSNVLTTVSNISSMEVYFSVTEKDAMRISQEGLSVFPPVKLQLADGTVYGHEGTVTKMSGVIDAATGSVQVIAVFSNPDKVLKSGGTGNIIIPRVNSSAIIIPQACVSEVQNKKFVYTLTDGNKVKYTEIKVDPQNDGNNYIVTEGLKAGDKYVTNGITKLNDGMEIVPITPERYQQKIDEQAKAMTAGDIVSAMQK